MQVKDFNKLLGSMYAEKAEITELKQKLAKLTADHEARKREVLEYMDEHEIEKYAHPLGTVYISNKFSVRVPKQEEDKRKLFLWLKEKGISMQYLTVNSNSLNSLYKAELEADGPDFEMPGVDAPKLVQILNLRGK